MKKEIGYIGFSEAALMALINSTQFDLRCVIWIEGRSISRAALDEVNRHKVKFFQVRNREELSRQVRKTTCKVFLMHRCPIIIPGGILGERTIFNIHFGDLRTNRGAHPIIWTILLGEKRTMASLYRVTDGIDSGMLISEEAVAVDDTDDTKSLQTKMDGVIPKLLETLYDFLEGSIAEKDILAGEYRRKICEKDYTIQPDVDSLATIRAKIRSQAAYRGAVLIIGDKKYFISDVMPAVFEK